MHIAETEDFWIREVAQKKFPIANSHAVSGLPSPDVIRKALMESGDHTWQYLESLSEPDLEQRIQLPDGTTFRIYDILWHVIEHEIHHRGEISLLLGMLGREGLDV